METTMMLPPVAETRRVVQLKKRSFQPLTVLILSVLLLFWFSGSLLQRLEPSAAVADPGVLSLVLLALLCLLTFTALSFRLLDLLWPVLNDYRKYHFQKNFKMLLPWQKLLFYLSAFFLLLFAFVCCLLAVL